MNGNELEQKLFARLKAEGHQVLPVWTKLSVESTSTIALFSQLKNTAPSFLFESAETDSASGRYSIMGFNAHTAIEYKNGEYFEHGIGCKKVNRTNVLNKLNEHLLRYQTPKQWAWPITGIGVGLFGFFGYESIRVFHPKLDAHLQSLIQQNKQPLELLGVPDFCFLFAPEIIIIDHFSGDVFAVVASLDIDNASWEQLQQQLAALTARIKKYANKSVAPLIPPVNPMTEDEFLSHFSQDAFEASINAIKSLIRDGEAFQVVLAQHLSIPFNAQPLDLFRALRAVSPTPYMYFLDMGEYQIVGASPETLCRFVNDNKRTVSVRPIAGTRRRGRTPAEDIKMEQELLSDPKEIAEHVMLVDLGRNDIGKIAQIGSVHVQEYLKVQRYRQVMHLVSTVVGKLRPQLTALDVLAATFPAGTLTGAPKIAAMQIIDSLEPFTRGTYGGGVGFLSYDGSFNFGICIRTALIKNNTLYVTAGGGVVADSVPKLEWKESLNKARSIFRATRRIQEQLRNE